MLRWDSALVFWTLLCTSLVSGYIERSWCYTQDELPHTVGCTEDHILSIGRAVPSVHVVNNHRFCQDPVFARGDCQLTDTKQSDHFRRMCNGQRTCVFLLVGKPQNTCHMAPRGPMYLYMQYTCIATKSFNGLENPVINPSKSRQTVAEHSIVWLQSSSYPSNWENLTHIPCTITSRADIRVQVTIYDLTVNPTVEEACAYHVMVGNNTKVCSKHGMATRTIDMELTDNIGDTERSTVNTSLVFIIGDGVASHGILTRYWLEVSGHTKDTKVPTSVKVTCMNSRVALVAVDETVSAASIWIPILVILIIIVAVILICIILWCLRRRKKGNISQNESTCEDRKHNGFLSVCISSGCTSCPCKSRSTVESHVDSEEEDGDDESERNSCCLCKRKVQTKPNPDSEDEKEHKPCCVPLCKGHSQDSKVSDQNSQTSDKRTYCWISSCTQKPAEGIEEDIAEDDKSDLCQSINSTESHQGETEKQSCFSRLTKKLRKPQKKDSNDDNDDDDDDAKEPVEDDANLDENSGELDKLTRSDSGLSESTGSESAGKERSYKDTTWLSRSETSV